MSKKFIPNGDEDFLTMARAFAHQIAQAPARFEVSDDDAVTLIEIVGRFQAAFQASRFGSRSAVATAAKEEARNAAESASDASPTRCVRATRSMRPQKSCSGFASARSRHKRRRCLTKRRG